MAGGAGRAAGRREGGKRAAQAGGKGAGSAGGGAERARKTDARFARVHTDPRFARQKPEPAAAAAAADERFAPRGRASRERGPRVDKRGFPLPRKGKASAEGGDGSDDEAASDDGYSTDSTEAATDSDDDEDAGSGSEEELAWGVAEDDDGDEADAPHLTGEETARLAVCNLDWDHLRAVDLLMLLKSFAPRGGSVLRVSVRPTDFGAQRLAEEAVSGPRAYLDAQRKKKQRRGGGDFEDDSEEEEQNGFADADPRSKELRKYERERLRYYFALVECDSAQTANALYGECDGLEFEGSGNCLDLRFVPDDMKLTRPPRELSVAHGGGPDEASAAPDRYKQPNFQTRALQHSNIELTWDADEPTRKKLKKGSFDDDDMEADDLKAYLADTDDDEGDDGEEQEAAKEAAAQKYLALLGTDNSGANVFGKAKASEFANEGARARKGGKGIALGIEEDKSMEMVIDTRLESVAKAAMKKREEAAASADETVWEKYLREKREKRKERKAKRADEQARAARGGDGDDDGDGMYEDAEGNPIPQGDAPQGGADGGADLGFDDPFFMNVDDGVDPFAADAGKGAKGNKKAKGGKKNRKRGAEGGGEDSGEDGAGDEAARQKRAELELLLMDDNALRMSARGVSAGMASAVAGGAAADGGEAGERLSRKERQRLKKQRRRSQLAENDSDGEAEAAEDGFKVNVEDSRFGALLSRPEFALDPTNPRFDPKSALSQEVSAARRRRDAREAAREAGARAPGKKGGARGGKSGGESDKLRAAREAVAAAEAAAAAKKSGMSSMVKNLKRKMAGRAQY